MPYGERVNKVGHGKVTPQKQKKKVDPEKVAKRVYENDYRDLHAPANSNKIKG